MTDLTHDQNCPACSDTYTELGHTYKISREREEGEE